MDSDFIITGWTPSMVVVDPAGRRREYTDRYASCFIVPLCGRIRFSAAEAVLEADREHPVFLPEGLSYVNECLEDARSFLFNFHLLRPMRPTVLAAVSEEAVRACAQELSRCAAAPSLQNTAAAMRALYSLACDLLAPCGTQPHAQELVRRVRAYMMLHYADPALTAGEIAASCYISEVWMRKLLTRETGTTPGRMLTDIRMEKAQLLLRERRPIGEVAHAVGYGDIFSFSRAYKRRFGHPPSRGGGE